MGKLRINARFWIIPNEILNNKNMTFKAKGIFGYLQSKPDNWDFSAARIQKDSKESRDAVLSGLQELEKNGYLRRTKYKNEKGQWDADYILYETAENNEDEVETIPENPTWNENETEGENPTPENPTPENPTSNKKRINKKEIDKKTLSLCTENKFSDDTFEVKAASYFYKTHEGIKTPSVLYLIKKEGFENLVYKQAAAVEKLKRIDGLSEQEIRAIILFALQDSFWQKNILSLEKLRKKNRDNVPYYVVLVDRIKSTIETQNSNLVHKF